MQRTQHVLLTRLARVSPTTAFLAVLVLALVAFFAPGVVGGLLLLLLAGLLGFLLATTWVVQTPGTRAVRLVILTALVAIALLKII